MAGGLIGLIRNEDYDSYRYSKPDSRGGTLRRGNRSPQSRLCKPEPKVKTGYLARYAKLVLPLPIPAPFSAWTEDRLSIRKTTESFKQDTVQAGTGLHGVRLRSERLRHGPSEFLHLPVRYCSSPHFSSLSPKTSSCVLFSSSVGDFS